MKKLIIIGTFFCYQTLFSQVDLNSSRIETKQEQVGPYCDTNKCGRWLTYYDNGEIAMVETFDDNGKLKGERVTFTKLGVIKHYTEWKNGVKVGKEIYFDEKGYPEKIIYNK
jgi:antitoxin component YwqK of YwqJK toxin-antitoxin module